MDNALSGYLHDIDNYARQFSGGSTQTSAPPPVVENIPEIVTTARRQSQGERPDLGRCGNSIRDQVESPIEKDLFDHYWLGRGTNVELDGAAVRTCRRCSLRLAAARRRSGLSRRSDAPPEAVRLPAWRVRCGVRHRECLLQPAGESRRLFRPIQLRHTLAWQPRTNWKCPWCSRGVRRRRELRSLRRHLWPVCQAIARDR